MYVALHPPISSILAVVVVVVMPRALTQTQTVSHRPPIRAGRLRGRRALRLWDVYIPRDGAGIYEEKRLSSHTKPVRRPPARHVMELIRSESLYLPSSFLQDETPGLQLLLSGQWVDVPPVPGAFIVNLGASPCYLLVESSSA